MQPTDNLKRLHQNLTEKWDGFTVPYDQFVTDMQDTTKLRKLHNNLSEKWEGFTVPYDQFQLDMWGDVKENGNNQQPELNYQQPQQSASNKIDTAQRRNEVMGMSKDMAYEQATDPVGFNRPIEEDTAGFKEGWQAGKENLKGGLKYLGGVIGETLDKHIGEEDDWEFDNRLMESARRNFENAPQGEGIWYELGSFAPQMIGIAAASVAAPITGGTSLAALPGIIGGANIAMLTGSAAGSAMHQYDQYKEEKGQESNDWARLGVGVASGAAEYLAERIGLDRYMPKGSMARAFTRFLSNNDDVAEKIAKDALKKNPSLSGFAKRTGKNMLEEGTEESITEIGNILIETMYKDKEDYDSFEEIVNRVGTAFKGGAMMGGVLSPITYGADIAYQRKMEGQQGQNPNNPLQNPNNPPSGPDSPQVPTINPEDTARADIENTIQTRSHDSGEIVMAYLEGVGPVMIKSGQYQNGKFNDPDGQIVYYDQEGNPNIAAQELFSGDVQSFTPEQFAQMEMGRFRQEMERRKLIQEQAVEIEGQLFVNSGQVDEQGNPVIVPLDQNLRPDESKATPISPEQFEQLFKAKQVKQEAVQEGKPEPQIEKATFGKTEYQVTVNEDGSSDVLIPNNVDPNKALAEINKHFEKNVNWQVEPQMETRQVPAKDRFSEPTTENILTGIKIVPKQIATPVPSQDNKESQKKAEPKYTFGKETITKEEVAEMINLADNAEELNGLRIDNDPELQQMLLAKFPDKTPRYRIAGQPATEPQVKAMIRLGKNLDQIQIENAPELQSLYDKKVKEFTKTVNNSQQNTKNVPKTETGTPVNTGNAPQQQAGMLPKNETGVEGQSNNLETRVNEIKNKMKQIDNDFMSMTERHKRELSELNKREGKNYSDTFDILNINEYSSDQAVRSKDAVDLANRQDAEMQQLMDERSRIQQEASSLNFSEYDFSGSQSVLDRIKNALNDIYRNNKSALDEGFVNWSRVINEVNNIGGHEYNAHGMGKSSIATALSDLIKLFEGGVNPFIGRGTLDTAPLTGDGLVGATGSGNAYMDGPFTLVTNRGKVGINHINDVAGIIVNDGIATPEILQSLRVLFPNLVIESTSNTKSLIEQLNAKNKPASKPGSSNIEAQKADIERRRQEELKRKEDELYNSLATLEDKRDSGTATVDDLAAIQQIKHYRDNYLQGDLAKVNAKYDAELSALENQQREQEEKNKIADIKARHNTRIKALQQELNNALATENKWDGKRSIRNFTNEILNDPNASIEDKVLVQEYAKNISEIQSTHSKTIKAMKGKQVTERKPRSLSEVQQRAADIEVFDPIDLVKQYFINGGKINKSAIEYIFGDKSGQRMGSDPAVEAERKARIGYFAGEDKGKGVDEIAHELFEMFSDITPEATSTDYRDAVIEVIQGFNSTTKMAESILAASGQQVDTQNNEEAEIEDEAREIVYNNPSNEDTDKAIEYFVKSIGQQNNWFTQEDLLDIIEQNKDKLQENDYITFKNYLNELIQRDSQDPFAEPEAGTGNDIFGEVETGQNQQGQRDVEEVQAEAPGQVDTPSATPLEAALDNAPKKAEIAKEEKKVEQNPSEAQKEAGNYPKGHIKVQGFDITIENAKGSKRSGTDKSGKKWEQTMNNTYGYFKRTKGKDGDQIDVFIGSAPETGKIFVVDQVIDGTFDEHKVMLGFNSEQEAREAYLSNYEEGWQGLGNITEVNREDFKTWLKDGTRTKEPFAEAAKQDEGKQTIPDSYGAYLLDKLDELFSKQFPNRKFDRQGIIDSWKQRADERSIDRANDALEDTVVEYYKPEERQSIRIDLRKQQKKQDVTPLEQKLDEIAEGKKKEKAPEIITDPAEVQRIKNSIEEGENILRTGKIHGRKLSPEELEQVKRSVDNSKRKIGIQVEGENAREDEGKSDNKWELGDIITHASGEKFSIVEIKKTADGKSDLYVAESEDGARISTTSDNENIVSVDKVNPKKEILKLESTESVEKLDDFGEKIGGAKKDLGITRTVRDTDSLPGWRRKYYYADPLGRMVIGKEIDTTQPFTVLYDAKDSFGRAFPRAVNVIGQRTPKLFTSEAEAEAYIPIYEVYKQGYQVRKRGDVFTIVKRSSTGKILEFDSFQTEEEANAFIYSTEGAISLLNRKKEDFSIPALEKVERTGKDWRKGKNISTDEFMNTFGFRGGEFGNWVKSEERRVLLNNAYDSFMDLAEMLNIPPRALSFGGNLSIAFGARGRKGASAHFEPHRAVINLTRMNGAGSLAHEWAHAMDNYFALQGAKKDYSRNEEGEVIAGFKMLTEADLMNRTGVRKSLLDKFDKIVDALVSKTVTRQMGTEEKQADFDRYQKASQREADALLKKFENGITRYIYNRKTKKREETRVKGTPEQIEKARTLVNKIINGEGSKPEWKRNPNSKANLDYTYVSPETIELDNLYKEVFGSTGLKRDGNGFYNLGYYANKLYPAKEALEKAKEGASETVKAATEFLKNSKDFDKTRVNPYWQKKLEMFARAFEYFIQTKLEESGIRSDYLQYDKAPIYESIYGISPYPMGEERETLNKLFQEFFDEVKTREEGGQTVLYDSPKEYRNLAEGETINAYGSKEKQTESIERTVSDIESQNPIEYGQLQDLESAERYDNSGRVRQRNYLLEKIKERTVLKDFKEAGYVDFIGKRIASPQDIADLFSIHRSPYIEKSHAVFVKNGTIVGTTAYTLNQSAATSFPDSDKIADLYNKYGADGIYLLHNHPSGNHEVSRQDVFFTAKLHDELSGLNVNLIGHVVIDTDKFSYINISKKPFTQAFTHWTIDDYIQDSVEIHEYKNAVPRLFEPREDLRTHVEPPVRLFEISKALLTGKGYKGAIIYLAQNLTITGYDVFPEGATTQDLARVAKEALDNKIGSRVAFVHDGTFKYDPNILLPATTIDFIDVTKGSDRFSTEKRKSYSSNDIITLWDKALQYRTTDSPAFRFGTAGIPNYNRSTDRIRNAKTSKEKFDAAGEIITKLNRLSGLVNPVVLIRQRTEVKPALESQGVSEDIIKQITEFTDDLSNKVPGFNWNGVTYIISDTIGNEMELVGTWLHEMSHTQIRKEYSIADRKQLYDDLMEEKPDFIDDILPKGEKYSRDHIKAEEAMAYGIESLLDENSIEDILEGKASIDHFPLSLQYALIPIFERFSYGNTNYQNQLRGEVSRTGNTGATGVVRQNQKGESRDGGRQGVERSDLPLEQAVRKIIGKKGAANLDRAEETNRRMKELEVAQRMEKEMRYSNGNGGVFRGKRFWSGSVSLLDGTIEEVHRYEKAEAADWHHSMYFSQAAQEKMANEESAFFWIQDGEVKGQWRQDIDSRLIKQIKDQIKIGPITPRDIRYATGWEKGSDGQWKYEINDNFEINKDIDQNRGDLKLPDLVKDDELFKAYPELREVGLIFINDGSKTDNQASYIQIEGYRAIAFHNLRLDMEGVTSDNNPVKRAILHEIQHSIQDVDGFAGGTAPKEALENYIKTYANSRDDVKREGKEELRDIPAEIYSDAIQEGFKKYGVNTIKELGEVLYRQSAGEVEARNVQTRMGMTEEQRRNTTLEETEDVSRDSQIVNGVQSEKAESRFLDDILESDKYSNRIRSKGNNGNFDPDDNSILFKRGNPFNRPNDNATPLEQAADRYAEKKRDSRSWKEIADGMREFYKDVDLPLRRLQEEIKRLGGKITDRSNPYRDMTLAKGRLERLYRLFVDEKMAPVLKTVSKIINTGVSGEEILPYVIAKHAIERNADLRQKDLDAWIQQHPDAGDAEIEAYEESIKGKDYAGVLPFADKEDGTNEYEGRPDELAQDIVNEFEQKVDPELVEELWNNMKVASTETLKIWKEGNSLSKEEYEYQLKRYKYFVPLRDWREGAAKQLRYHKGSGFGRSLIHAQGRRSLAENPFAYIEKVAFKALGEQVDNEVNQAMLNLVIDNYGKPEFKAMYQLKTAYYIKTVDPITQEEVWELARDKEGNLVKPSDDQFKAGNVKIKVYSQHEKLRSKAQAGEHEVMVKQANQDVVIVFKGKYLTVAQALKHQNTLFRYWFGLGDGDATDWNEPLAKTLGRMNNWLKAMYTSYNIVFPLTNFFRDAPEASLTQYIKGESGAQVIKNYRKSFPAIIRDMFGMKGTSEADKLLKRFYLAGGATGYTHEKTPQQIEKELNRKLRDLVNKGKIKGMAGRNWRTLKKLVETWNRVFEDATRLSVFISAIEQGHTDKDAASMAKEASVNFNRKGKSSKAFDSYWAFWNVALESMFKNFGLAKRYPKRFSQVATGYVAAGFLMAMLNDLMPEDDDDEEYYNISDFTRHNYLLIPNLFKLMKDGNKGDLYLRIPLPPFWRGFYAAGSLGWDVVSGNQTAGKAIPKTISYFIQGLSPVDIAGFYKEGKFSLAPLFPTVTRPVVEVKENRDFMGYAISRVPFTKELEETLADAGLHKKNVNPAVKLFTDLLFKAGGGEMETMYKDRYEDGQMKTVPEALDWNPSKIEHIFKGYTGETGGVVSDIITTIAQVADPDEELDIRNLPFINAFIRKTPEAKWKVIQEYYDLSDELPNYEKVVSKYKKNVTQGGATQAQIDKYKEAASDSYARSYVATLEGYKKIVDTLSKNLDMDTAEGSEEIIEMMEQTIEAIDKLKKQYNKK